MKAVYERLKQETKGSVIYLNELMSKHTSFCIGGPADIFVDVAIEDIPAVLTVSKEENLPITILGNGTNILVGDLGIRGIVMCLGECASGVEVSENVLKAGAGENLNALVKTALENSMTGLEFATGIPGSVGGAAVMNAGAYDGQISDLIKSVRCIDTIDGSEKIFDVTECEYDYRHSIFLDSTLCVVEVEFLMQDGNKDEILNKMKEITKSRANAQPLDFPSAGSVFKRPKGDFAGRLISDAGLKGYRVGGAAVSNKHAGFIINENNATASDVKKLIEHITKEVKEKSKTELKKEVRFIGDFGE